MRRDEDGGRITEVEASPGNIIDNSPIGLYIVQGGQFRMVNLRFQHLTGYSETELVGTESLRLVHPEDREAVRANAILMLKGHRTSPYEYRVVSRDGEIIHALETVTSIEYRGKRASFGNFMNITERKLAEEKARRLGQIVRLLGQVSQLILETNDERELLRKACAFIIASQHYRLVWFGYTEKGSFDILPFAQGGPEGCVPPPPKARWDDSELGGGPTGMAVKMGRPFVTRDVANDPWYRPWREEALIMGYRSAAALSLRVDGETVGALTVCSRYPDAFDDEELGLLSEIAGSISLGIQKIRHDEQFRRANDALRQSEQTLKLMFDSMTDGVLFFDLDYRIVEVNQAKVRMHGYTRREELIGRDTLELLHERERAAARERLRKIVETGVVPSVERRMLRKDGSEFDAELHTAMLKDAAGKPLGLITISRDITEQKRVAETLRRSEEMFRLMFESMTDGVIIADPEGKILRVNEAKVRMHGYASKEELIGKRVTDLTAERDRLRMLENMAKALGGASLPHVEYTLLYKDGREFPADISRAVIRDASGQPLGFIGVIRDITEHKKLEERLMVADRLASVGELASGIAHEINNPLTSILGFAELLFGRQDLPQDALPDLEIIRHESQRAATIVRNLLAFARGQTTAKAPLDVNAAIENVLSLRAYEHRANNIQVVARLAEDLPPVIADSFQIQQALINIIINGEYFMVEAHGKGTLTIITEQELNTVRITIADDGPGIARKDLVRIFDPFFTTKLVGKGTGLGLSICHGIITEHGGQVYCESEPGKGATFFVRLPAARRLEATENANTGS